MKRNIILIAALLLSYATFAQQETDNAAAVASPAATEVTSDQEQATISAEELWTKANEAYNNAEFSQAEKTYRAIIEQRLHSAKLYYNLANTLFKQEKLGEAILYYNKALRLAPADEDIRHNLEYAEQSTKDSIEQIPEFFLFSWIKAVRSIMSSDGWAILSLAILLITLIAALLYLLAQRLATRKAGFYIMSFGVVIFIIATAFASKERQLIINHNEAIVMSSAVSVKSSPDRAATELFVLHEGTKLSIGERMSGWVEVRIADGRKGWIETSRIAEI